MQLLVRSKTDRIRIQFLVNGAMWNSRSEMERKKSMAWCCVPVSPKKKPFNHTKKNEKSAFSFCIYHLTLQAFPLFVTHSIHSTRLFACLFCCHTHTVGNVDDWDIENQRTRYRERWRDKSGEENFFLCEFANVFLPQFYVNMSMQACFESVLIRSAK